MPRPTPAQQFLATALLAHERAAEPAHDGGLAAGRVYDKLHLHLAPLLGKAGVELLLVRSAKLVLGEFAFLTEASILGGAAALHARVRPPAPALTDESVTALFATFFALLMTFIGERLTIQVLRSGWPTFVAMATETST